MALIGCGPERGHVLAFDGGALCVPGFLAKSAGPEWFDPQAVGGLPVGEGGRQAAWFVQGPFGAAVLRHYRRGGLRARLGREAYFWLGAARTRSFAEYAVLARLRTAGVAVPEPLGAAYWRHGFGYRAAILVARVPGARTLAGCLGATAVPDAARAAGPVDAVDPLPVARAIHAMHEAGVSHADLNAHNILLDEQGRVWLIDFDRAVVGVVSQGQRRKNLLRLRRSLVKVCGAPGARWWDALRSAYGRPPC
ncbi:3-deoxy-D-manno-octulosonic acid kinase [Castellaniella sp. GW247-6E4]|uniref:3-deoxy-D-manno-octulosonic acid kinase n=1 Tax=Castellaniella sp. GW247-6E4 TaxID=3140380 RepID=UPI0033158AE5